MDCCLVTESNNIKFKRKSKKCIRKKDKKIFEYPRLYSKKKCLEGPIEGFGFTKKASCAPYIGCQKGGNKPKNIYNQNLEVCSTNPMTGYYRNGYCQTGPDDLGTHTVCAKMDSEFLNYTARKGNDLSSVVKPGQNWCLCEYRWNQAYIDGKAPEVLEKSTNIKTKKNIVNNIKKHRKSKNY